MYAERTFWHSFELVLTSTPEGYSNESVTETGKVGYFKIRETQGVWPEKTHWHLIFALTHTERNRFEPERKC